MTGEFAPWLAPLAALYGLGVGLRNALHDRGVWRTVDSGLPVISVGNLAVGGTGKTPATIWLAGQLAAAGHAPAILTRGYGRRSRLPVLLAPGRQERTPDEAGDEPLEMAAALPGVPVMVAADRALGARLVRRACRPDLLLLDDGFQHRRLARDVDLVLLDARAPFGNGRLLPAGPLREPIGALRRAQLVLLTRAERVAPAALAAAEAAVRARLVPGAWLGVAEHRITGLAPLAGPAGAPPAPGSAVAVAAGIADPAGFAAAVGAAGWPAAEVVALADHARVGPAERARVVAMAAGRPVVTTRKDAIRWRAGCPGVEWPNWWVAGLDFVPRDPAGLLSAIEARLRSFPGGKTTRPGRAGPGRAQIGL